MGGNYGWVYLKQIHGKHTTHSSQPTTTTGCQDCAIRNRQSAADDDCNRLFGLHNFFGYRVVLCWRARRDDFLLFGQLANSRVESGLSWLHWPLVAGRICGMHSRITRVEALPTHAQPLAGFHFVALRNHWLSQSASKLGIGMSIAFGFCISLYARIYLSGGSTSRTDANETS